MYLIFEPANDGCRFKYQVDPLSACAPFDRWKESLTVYTSIKAAQDALTKYLLTRDKDFDGHFESIKSQDGTKLSCEVDGRTWEYFIVEVTNSGENNDVIE